MKITDLIQELGRPVAYYPKLAKALGGVKQVVFISQALYWIGIIGINRFYKSSEEWEEETGLTYEEQKTARGYLNKLGVLKNNYSRLDHKMYFEFDLDRLNELWEGSLGIVAKPCSPKGRTPCG